MHHPAHLVGAFFFHNAQGVFAGVTHVNDQRLAGNLCGLNMFAKTHLLPVSISFFSTKIIQPGFANSDNLLIVGQFDQLIDIGIPAFAFIGVHPDGGGNKIIFSRRFQHLLKMLQIDTDAKHVIHTLRAREFKRAVQLVVKRVQIKPVKMAMRINEKHG